MKIKLFVVLQFVFVSVAVFAQSQFTQTVRGLILDKNSQLPLPGVNVVVETTNPAMGSSTDADGYFKIDNVPVGRHTIRVSYIGYNEIYLRNVELITGKQAVLNLSMDERVEQVEEVVVSGVKKTEALNKMATVSARTFSVEETQRFAGSLNDVSRMAMNYAGVQAAGDAVNDIVIRGNSPMGLLWRLEGVDIPNPNHFGDGGATGGPVGMLNNNVLANSDFFTGAFPSEYGNALSGVFDLNMRNGNDDKHEFVGQVGFNGFELGAEGPLSRESHASYLVNYRYSTLDVMSKLGMDFGTGTAIPRYQDLTGKVHIPTQNIGTFDVFWLAGYSSIEFLDSKRDTSEEKTQNLYTDSEMDIYSKSGLAVLGVSHKKVFDNNLYSKITLASTYSYNSNEADSVVALSRESIPVYRSKRHRMSYIVHAFLNKRFDKKNNVRLGLISTIRTIDMHDSVIEVIAFEPLLDYSGTISFFQPYINFQHKFSEDVTLNTGVHSQYLTLNGQYSVEPRAGVKWDITKKGRVNVGYGYHSQIAPIDELLHVVRMADNSFKTTNENLEFTKSNHFVVGYDHSFTQFLRAKVELYYQLLYDVPVAQSSPAYSLLNRGSFSYDVVDTLVNKGTGENMGAELTLEKFMNNGFYWLGTLSVFESTYEGYDGVKRSTAFNGNYVFNIVGGKEWKLNKKPEAKNQHCIAFDVKYTQAGGQYYTPIDVEESRLYKETRYYDDPAKAFSKKFDDYLRFDIRIGWKIVSRKYTQEYAFDIQNVTNRLNPYREMYDSTTDEVTMQTQTGFFPMMLYRISF